MDYTGEGVGKEAGSTGGSNGLALIARNPAPSRSSCAGAGASTTEVADTVIKHVGAGDARRPLERCALP